MAETSGFFNAHVTNGEYDRVYLAEQFAKYFSSFIGNGIFGGKLSELMVAQRADSGMKVTVLPGMGWINGFWYENSSNLTLNIDVSDGVLNRIDNIVVRWGKTERKIWIDIIKGIPATNAVAPNIQRNSEYYDLKLAEIHVDAGLINITQANIIDTRLNTDVCGLVTGVIDQIDTSEYAKQLDNFVSSYAAEFKAFLESLELNSTKELENMFDRLNALIEDESAFATLVLDVDKVANEAALASQTLGYYKKNLAVYPYAGTSRTEDGIAWIDNGDGTITANGTATQQAHFLLNQRLPLKPGKYIISAGLETSQFTYFIYIEGIKKPESTSSEYVFYSTYANQLFEITEYDIENYNFYFAAVIMSGITVSNVVFKPMVRRAEILDETWEPYKLSVNELLNPDSRHGVEYLTAESWNGKRVYQKTFYVASLPNNSFMAINVDVDFTKVISVTGYALNTDDNLYHPFPIITDGITPIAAICEFMGDGGTGGDIVIRTVADTSNYKAYITIKYTKD